VACASICINTWFRAPRISLRSASSACIMQLLFINIIDCLVITLSLYLLAAFRDYRRRRGLPYPPGPPSRPIIGNLLDVPKAKEAPWIKYTEMSKKYGRGNSRNTGSLWLKPAFQGDVICLRVFSEVVIILCSLSAIKDFLEKRAEFYSERPSLPVLKMYIKLHFFSLSADIDSPKPLGRIQIGPYW
jgi:hypothetical protein